MLSGISAQTLKYTSVSLMGKQKHNIAKHWNGRYCYKERLLGRYDYLLIAALTISPLCVKDSAVM